MCRTYTKHIENKHAKSLLSGFTFCRMWSSTQRTVGAQSSRMCSLTASLDRQADRGILAVLSAPKRGDSYHPLLSACSACHCARRCTSSLAQLVKGLASKSNACAAAEGHPSAPSTPGSLPVPSLWSSPNHPTPPLGSLGQAPSLGQKEENPNPPQDPCLEKSHEQRSLKGYSPWGCKRVGHHSA